MNVWNVTFEGASAGISDDFNLKFIDLNDIVEKYLALSSNFLDVMKSRILEEESYKAIGNIKSVTDPGGKSVTTGAFFAVLAIDKNDLKFGYLFGGTATQTLLVAVWPEGFAAAAKKDSRLLQVILGIMAERPDNWKRVDVILPLK